MINIGLIGCGRFANNYIKIINSFKGACSIPLLCSRSPKSYNGLREKPSGDHIWVNNYKKICQDPDINLIIICTPPESHYEIAKYALEHKKHVLCEKPFVFETEQAEELKKIAEEKNVCLVIDYIHLWNPFYQRIKEYVNSGEAIQIDYLVNAPKTGREHHSILWDWASHEVAMISHLYKEPPESIRGVTSDTNIKDSSSITFRVFTGPCKHNVYINIDSDNKVRQIKATKSNGDYLMVRDNFASNPLEQVVADMLNAIDNNIRITNVDIAIKSTQLLKNIEQQMA